jgi:hypothetical protein
MWPIERADTRRLHIAVPVRLIGRDLSGRDFNREAWTLNVSSAGAAIQIPTDLDLPQRFHIRSEDYQFRADADVIVVWERAKPQRAVGVRVASDTDGSLWQAR